MHKSCRSYKTSMSKSLGVGPGWGTVQAWSTVHCRQKLSELSRAFNQLKLDKKKQEEDFAAQEMESVARLTSKVDISMLLQLHRRPVTTECVSVSLAHRVAVPLPTEREPGHHTVDVSSP